MRTIIQYHKLHTLTVFYPTVRSTEAPPSPNAPVRAPTTAHLPRSNLKNPVPRYLNTSSSCPSSLVTISRTPPRPPCWGAHDVQ